MIAALVKKEALMYDWELLPRLWEKVERHGVFTIHHDWTLHEERPKNYDVIHVKPQ